MENSSLKKLDQIPYFIIHFTKFCNIYIPEKENIICFVCKFRVGGYNHKIFVQLIGPGVWLEGGQTEKNNFFWKDM